MYLVHIQDMASFGYGVGEIEVMCADASEVKEAAASIGRLGTELGVSMASEKGHLSSKVSMVLMSERPEHYSALKQAGLI